MKEIRIQSTLHLCGMAALKINPEYISYVQNGSKLYYWVQKISENMKVVQLMELDLLSKDLIETSVDECC